MATSLFIISFFLTISVCGQTSPECKIEIYLLKEKNSSLVSKDLTMTTTDFEDTAFISDKEISMYTFQKFKVKVAKGVRITRRIHTIKTSTTLSDKIDNNKLLRSPRKFAILINNEIVYSGYLSSTLSSIVPDSSVDARISSNELSLYYYSSQHTYKSDPRENKSLFNCLKQTNRFIFSTKRTSR